MKKLHLSVTQRKLWDAILLWLQRCKAVVEQSHYMSMTPNLSNVSNQNEFDRENSDLSNAFIFLGEDGNGPVGHATSYSTLPKLLARKLYVLETHEGRNEMCGWAKEESRRCKIDIYAMQWVSTKYYPRISAVWSWQMPWNTVLMPWYGLWGKTVWQSARCSEIGLGEPEAGKGAKDAAWAWTPWAARKERVSAASDSS